MIIGTAFVADPAAAETPAGPTRPAILVGEITVDQANDDWVVGVKDVASLECEPGTFRRVRFPQAHVTGVLG